MIAIKYFKISMQIKRVVLLSPATRMLITLLTEIKSAVNDLKTQVARNTQLLQTVHSSVPDALEEVEWLTLISRCRTNHPWSHLSRKSSKTKDFSSHWYVR